MAIACEEERNTVEQAKLFDYMRIERAKCAIGYIMISFLNDQLNRLEKLCPQAAGDTARCGKIVVCFSKSFFKDVLLSIFLKNATFFF